MSAEQRKHVLLAHARRDGALNVATVAVELNVARETIRRDLTALERAGLVSRTPGGAHPVESAGFEKDLTRRAVHNVDKKRRIAATAVSFLGDAETIFLDEGYTPEMLAGELPAGRRLTVVTTSLRTASVIAESPNLTVLVLGGKLRSRTMATAGSWASSMLSRFVIDLAFIGAAGISRNSGLTAPDPVVAEVKSLAVKASRRRIFIGDHSKFGVSAFCRFADVKDFEMIITDTSLPATEAQRYSLMGPRVVRV